MRVRVLRDLDDVQRIVPAWEELAASVGGGLVTHPLWALPWWSHLGRGRLRVVTVEAAGSLVALAPLHERRLAGLPVVRFLGHGLGAVGEMLVRDGEEDAAERAWLAVLGEGVRLLQLLDYRSDGGGLQPLRRVAGGTAIVRPSDLCKVLQVEGDLDGYLARRSKGLRRSLRRADERLAEEGRNHEVEVVTAPARLQEVLPEVTAVHDRAEASKARQHLLSGAEGAFTRAMLAEAATGGRLRLFVGRIDGQAVSFDAAVRNGDRLEVWLGRIDPAYRRFSPGHLACRQMVTHAHEASLRELDLGLGDDAYKRLWCQEEYATVDVVAGSSHMALRLGTGLLEGARVLRATPAAARRLLPGGGSAQVAS